MKLAIFYSDESEEKIEIIPRKCIILVLSHLLYIPK